MAPTNAFEHVPVVPAPSVPFGGYSYWNQSFGVSPQVPVPSMASGYQCHFNSFASSSTDSTSSLPSGNVLSDMTHSFPPHLRNLVPGQRLNSELPALQGSNMHFRGSHPSDSAFIGGNALVSPGWSMAIEGTGGLAERSGMSSITYSDPFAALEANAMPTCFTIPQTSNDCSFGDLVAWNECESHSADNRERLMSFRGRL